MEKNFEKSLDYTFGWEGGYGNHPSDPGGPTNWGITIHDYRKYINPRGTANDVSRMPKSQAASIYHQRYWLAQNCDDMPSGVDFALFDYGVNSGIGRSQKVIQRIVGVKVDGQVGPITLKAISAKPARVLIGAICDERLAFVKSLRTWPTFGKGWSRRIAGVRDQAIGML